ncbi:hypothetical protein GJ654_05660 [Rhodoblastus acidophilus]|uniref:DUF1311 domain-containing protein n=1 Tax=Rhodoblastus acidophilus TaxID=1074 RepID=A0A6N8DJF3_RHOAC|nr:hypothetical protein [Rhodoblastus acidophilus]MCW2273437.1 uncharacterized protein YecT (DUF1311 family) [Rhodoblastus acidophilus]MTV30477.1 hypothetical protein [Rhodoblastus acidophilus]
MKTAALLILLAAALAPSARAASFDCGKARTPLERRICADPALGQADEDLSKAYAETLRTFVVPEFIKDSQRAWLFEAPQCLENKTCAELFKERAETLRLYRSAKVYTDYGKDFDREKTTLVVYERNGKPWLDWYGDWMPDAYRPKPFPDGFLARDGGELIPAKGKFTLADHDDAIISLSDDKITFGGEYGMSLTARQGFIHGDFLRVR